MKKTILVSAGDTTIQVKDVFYETDESLVVLTETYKTLAQTLNLIKTNYVFYLILGQAMMSATEFMSTLSPEVLKQGKPSDLLESHV